LLGTLAHNMLSACPKGMNKERALIKCLWAFIQQLEFPTHRERGVRSFCAQVRRSEKEILHMDRNKLLVRAEGKICCSELPNRKIAADLLFFSAHEIVSKLPIFIYTARSCMKTISRSDVCLPVNRV
jgi:hypothetical protein